jgi:chemotaxis protein CheC
MITVQELTPTQQDVLREVTNVGAGHAATALAQLAGVKISIDVPQIWSAPFEEIVGRTSPDADDEVAVVSMRVLGDLAGQIMFVMRKDAAASLLDVLLGRTPGTGTISGEMERSGLQETGNIMASSFLNALARWMGKILLPSVPTVAVDNRDAVIRAVWHGNEEAVLAAETAFSLAQPDGKPNRLTGVLVFMLEGPSLDAILTALRVGR